MVKSDQSVWARVADHELEELDFARRVNDLQPHQLRLRKDRRSTLLAALGRCRRPPTRSDCSFATHSARPPADGWSRHGILSTHVVPPLLTTQG